MTNEVLNLDEIKSRANTIEIIVEETKVESNEDLKKVSDTIKNIKDLGKYIKSQKEEYTRPAQDIINKARENYLPYEKACKDAEDKLKNKAGIYMEKKEQKRLAEEKKVAEGLEAGKIKEETGMKKLEKIGDEAKSVAGEGSSITRKRGIPEVIIVDPTLVPKEYWIIDTVKLNKVARAGIEIPGVELKETYVISSR